jgi:hypothetical protein
MQASNHNLLLGCLIIGEEGWASCPHTWSMEDPSGEGIGPCTGKPTVLCLENDATTTTTIPLPTARQRSGGGGGDECLKIHLLNLTTKGNDCEKI